MDYKRKNKAFDSTKDYDETQKPIMQIYKPREHFIKITFSSRLIV